MLREIKNKNYRYFEDELGRKQGEYKSYLANGSLYVHCFYVDDKRHGEYKEWHASGNGQVWEHCFFVNELAVSFKEIPYPTTPEDRLYFALKYNLLLLPVEKVC